MVYWTYRENGTGIIYKSEMDGSKRTKIFEYKNILPAKFQLDIRTGSLLYFISQTLRQGVSMGIPKCIYPKRDCTQATAVR